MGSRLSLLRRPHEHCAARALSAAGNAFFLRYCDSERLDSRRLMSAALVSGNDVGRASVIPIEVNQVIADVVAIGCRFNLQRLNTIVFAKVDNRRVPVFVRTPGDIDTNGFHGSL